MVPFIWFGMVLAISFIEAPLKFQAPGITIPLGLGIGRLVFYVLNKAEIFWAILLVAALWRTRDISRSMFITISAAAVILLLQTVWLLPALDARAELVIAGNAPPFSNNHIVYIVFDAIKLLSLLIFGLAAVKSTLDHNEK